VRDRRARTRGLRLARRALIAFGLAFVLLASAAVAAPGDLDPGFGSGGKAVVSFGGTSEEGGAVALQSDGKIVVAGTSNVSRSLQFAVARLTAQGTPDMSFGSGGQSLVSFGFGGSQDFAQAVAVQPDGKIIAAGFDEVAGGNNTSSTPSSA